MSDAWSEDDIKAQLRELTEHTRKLRKELEAMIGRPETPPSRRFLHRGATPDEAEARATVDERRRKR